VAGGFERTHSQRYMAAPAGPIKGYATTIGAGI